MLAWIRGDIACAGRAVWTGEDHGGEGVEHNLSVASVDYAGETISMWRPLFVHVEDPKVMLSVVKTSGQTVLGPISVSRQLRIRDIKEKLGFGWSGVLLYDGRLMKDDERLDRIPSHEFVELLMLYEERNEDIASVVFGKLRSNFPFRRAPEAPHEPESPNGDGDIGSDDVPHFLSCQTNKTNSIVEFINADIWNLPVPVPMSFPVIECLSRETSVIAELSWQSAKFFDDASSTPRHLEPRASFDAEPNGISLHDETGSDWESDDMAPDGSHHAPTSEVHTDGRGYLKDQCAGYLDSLENSATASSLPRFVGTSMSKPPVSPRYAGSHEVDFDMGSIEYRSDDESTSDSEDGEEMSLVSCSRHGSEPLVADFFVEQSKLQEMQVSPKVDADEFISCKGATADEECAPEGSVRRMRRTSTEPSLHSHVGLNRHTLRLSTWSGSDGIYTADEDKVEWAIAKHELRLNDIEIIVASGPQQMSLDDLQAVQAELMQLSMLFEETAADAFESGVDRVAGGMDAFERSTDAIDRIVVCLEKMVKLRCDAQFPKDSECFIPVQCDAQ